MKLSPPTKLVFVLSLLVAIVSLLTVFGVVSLSFIPVSGYWLMAIAYGLLFIGNLFKGL